MYKYKCRVCGCNVDPDEYNICDECKQKELEEDKLINQNKDKSEVENINIGKKI